MAPPFRASRRSSPLLRGALLIGLCAVLRHLGPAFNVKGSWDGDITEVSSFPAGIQTNIRGSLRLKDTGAVVTMDDGRLNMEYAKGPVSLRLDDTNAWQANITEDDLKLLTRGTGLHDISWEASKQGSVAGLGDVRIDVNSDRDYAVAVAPSLPKIAGIELKGLAQTHGDGIRGRLEAQRKLHKNVDLQYSVENEEGDYDPANLVHAAQLVGRHPHGALTVAAGGRGDDQSFNATYSHALANAGDGFVVGADNDGIYGTLAKSTKLGKGFTAGYQFAGRSDVAGSDPSFAHMAKLSHKLGSLKLSQNQDEPLEALLESDIVRGSNRVQGKLGYSLIEEEPYFNVTASKDFTDALAKLGVQGSAVVGIDEASEDGLYGQVTASRDLGKGLGLHYASSGRIKDMKHSMKLSNKLGYAQVVKAGDHEPRLQVGYEFNA